MVIVFLRKELDACKCTDLYILIEGQVTVSPDSHKEKPVQCSEVSADNDCEWPKLMSQLFVTQGCVRPWGLQAGPRAG